MDNKHYWETPQSIHIVIDKPLFSSFVYIRDKYIQRAKDTGKKLVIKINGLTAICTPKEWLKDAKKAKMEKYIKGVPMIMFGNFVEKFIPKKLEENVSVINNLTILPEKYRLQIKSKLGLKLFTP